MDNFFKRKHFIHKQEQENKSNNRSDVKIHSDKSIDIEKSKGILSEIVIGYKKNDNQDDCVQDNSDVDYGHATDATPSDTDKINETSQSVNDSSEIGDDLNFDFAIKKTNSLSFDDIKKRQGIQNLTERTRLLNILKTLFAIQLIAMNLLVALVIIWTVFDFTFFNDVNANLLNEVVGFLKFYISAILVELLSAIVYIIHKVFSLKIKDL